MFALALVPRRVRRDIAEHIVAKTDPAKPEIVARLVTEIDRHFEIEEKPPPAGEPSHSVWQAMPRRDAR